MSAPRSKGSSAEPDWGKFGLEGGGGGGGERQPLKGGPGKADNGATRSTGAAAGGDMYGGQIQHDTELFADDQGSKAPPWWLSSLLVSPDGRVLFGTWDGVFTSCLINIFGVIVFLRSGWVVAEAGVASAAAIVAAAVALILVAVFAAIGICERCHVRSGGVYFLISHVLGSRRGAAVGIIYVIGQVFPSSAFHGTLLYLAYLPQAIGNALCATGFGESIAGLLAPDHSPMTERAVAAIVIAFLTLVNAAGVKWVIRLQFALLVILLLGAADFLVGSLTHTDPGEGTQLEQAIKI